MPTIEQCKLIGNRRSKADANLEISLFAAEHWPAIIKVLEAAKDVLENGGMTNLPLYGLLHAMRELESR